MTGDLELSPCEGYRNDVQNIPFTLSTCEVQYLCACEASCNVRDGEKKL